MTTELDSASFEKAINSEKPAVVDFWAGWCMPCKIFSPVMEEVSDQLDGKADFYKLNIDDYQEIARDYSIASIPTVIVFKGGKAVEQFVGVRAKEEVVEAIEKHL